jgi:hypothetical protein
VEIESIADFDLIRAHGVNLSETGIAFEVDQPPAFEMRFKMEGRVRTHGAQLMWMKRQPEGNYRFGFRFYDLQDHDQL